MALYPHTKKNKLEKFQADFPVILQIFYLECHGQTFLKVAIFILASFSWNLENWGASTGKTKVITYSTRQKLSKYYSEFLIDTMRLDFDKFLLYFGTSWLFMVHEKVEEDSEHVKSNSQFAILNRLIRSCIYWYAQKPLGTSLVFNYLF